MKKALSILTMLALVAVSCVGTAESSKPLYGVAKNIEAKRQTDSVEFALYIENLK